MVLEFQPDSIRPYSDTLFLKSNARLDSTVRITISGQGVGTGITVDDSDPTAYIFPPEVQNWVGKPDPANLDKWYRYTSPGIGTKDTRMLAYIYFNPPTGLQRVEWYPQFPLNIGSTENEPDDFDVYVTTPDGSSNSTPTARYIINQNNGKVDTVIASQNGITTGQIYLGRYTFLRGGSDSHGSGNVFGSVWLENDTALVSAFYQNQLVNPARQDSHFIRADALILKQAGVLVGIYEPSYIPLEYSLSQNYPNPFNPVTQIRYTLPQLSNVTLKIYDILGREVRTLVNSEQPVGAYRLEWSGTNNFGTHVSSGVYIYRIVAGKFVQTKKMMFLK